MMYIEEEKDQYVEIVRRATRVVDVFLQHFNNWKDDIQRHIAVERAMEDVWQELEGRMDEFERISEEDIEDRRERKHLRQILRGQIQLVAVVEKLAKKELDLYQRMATYVEEEGEEDGQNTELLELSFRMTQFSANLAYFLEIANTSLVTILLRYRGIKSTPGQKKYEAKRTNRVAYSLQYIVYTSVVFVSIFCCFCYILSMLFLFFVTLFIILAFTFGPLAS